MNDRQKALLEALETRILILDGAMGTMIQQQQLTAADFGGPALEGCNDHLVLTRPDAILKIHRAYFEAGADIVETDTFNGHEVSLGEYDIGEKSEEINRVAAQLARQAADEYSSAGRTRFVAGSMGPTTRSVTVTRNVTFEQMKAGYYTQAKGLIEGGADFLVIETAQDTRNIKAALLGVDRLEKELGHPILKSVSGTIEPMGTMLAGQTADALYSSIAHASLLSVGLNCATGPEFMTDHIRTLHEMASTRTSCYPNAGLPNEDGKYLETPESLAAQLERFVENGWLNMVGGCCGTTPDHIRAIAEMVAGKTPRALKPPSHRAFYSGIELVEAEDSNRPLIVGERTNVIGSRLFKNMVAEEKWEEASEIARWQIRNGAHIVDVCLQSSDREEMRDIPPFYEKLIRKAKAPIMIDTTDPIAVELALTYCQGKSIINSINLEDGEEKFERLCPIAKAYGAALIVGTIDEDKVQAQAFTRERKLEVAQRSVALLTEKYGIPAEDIIIDPLVFPCATGDENYIGGAVETIEAIRLVKEKIPFVKTVLGISNISFGLPAAAREVVNSVFLYYCTKAGLDLAIVNSEKLERFASIPIEERRLAENLLFNTPPAEVPAPEDWRQQTREQKIAINQFHIAGITDHFRKTGRKEKKKADDLPLDERLANYIIEGTKDGLVPDLDRKLAEGAAPLDVINGPLMAGMTEVGRLFNNNELIVAEVLQSAESMKAAVNHLEQFMVKSETAARGKIVLATVKGDVHDIGKNLVEIILSNNGYTVVNLGIKVPPEDLIKAFHEHRPDAIGLSGLLVKSAQMMVITAQDLKTAEIGCPILVGGAALSNRFTRMKIAPEYNGLVAYANDAMNGLDLANQIMDRESRDSLKIRLEEETQRLQASASKVVDAPTKPAVRASVRRDIEIPRPPDLKLHVIRDYDLGQIFDYINPKSLYAKHLGFRNFEEALANGDAKARELSDRVEEVAHLMIARSDISATAIYKFFPAQTDGDRTLMILSPDGKNVIESFIFGRQSDAPGLSLADYIAPRDSGRLDYVSFFITTIGTGVRALAEEWKNKGDYLRSHILQVLGLEGAEAFAELLHEKIRAMWGIGDPAGIS